MILLRDIEHQQYDPAQFVNELKEQITAIVNQVLADNSNRRVTLMPDKPSGKRSKPKQGGTQ